MLTLFVFSETKLLGRQRFNSYIVFSIFQIAEVLYCYSSLPLFQFYVLYQKYIILFCEINLIVLPNKLNNILSLESKQKKSTCTPKTSEHPH